MNETTNETNIIPEVTTAQPKTAVVNGRPCTIIRLEISQQDVYVADYLESGEDDDATDMLMKGTVISSAGTREIPYENNVAYTNHLIKSGIKKIVKDGQDVEYGDEWRRAVPKPDMSRIRDFITSTYTESQQDGEKKKA